MGVYYLIIEFYETGWEINSDRSFSLKEKITLVNKMDIIIRHLLEHIGVHCIWRTNSENSRQAKKNKCTDKIY